MRYPLLQPDSGEFGFRKRKGAGHAGKLQRHGDVFQRGHGRDQVKGLEDNADMAAAEAGKPILIQLRKILIEQPYRSRISTFQAAKDHQERRFPGSGGADKANALAAIYMKGDPFEDMNAAGAAAKT
ncbi:hypothetical protein GCM10007276_20240 [Agaricicola taiwanensis]|uniref:Uncharacterized protein n=1 Tax=Agaricicola taiwanensis TaxID=591372 RepID=A0A8J3DW34_9RHOB|nr:hypothetical protein GCM10007276_20240 [Agaricicola taiwanensis]